MHKETVWHSLRCHFVFNDKQKYVHKVLFNRLVKLAQEKKWLTDRPHMAIAFDRDVKHHTKQTYFIFNTRSVLFECHESTVHAL